MYDTTDRDESDDFIPCQDVANLQHLILYMKVVDPHFNVKTVFLGLKELRDKKSVTMYQHAKISLNEHRLAIQDVAALGTDGTNSMVGRNNGLVGLMLRENPVALDFHCGAHVTALGAKDSFAPDLQFQEIEKLVNKVRCQWTVGYCIFISRFALCFSLCFASK